MGAKMQVQHQSVLAPVVAKNYDCTPTKRPSMPDFPDGLHDVLPYYLESLKVVRVIQVDTVRTRLGA